VGDEKYGDFAINKSLAKGELVPSHRFDRMFLHAAQLRFEHPQTGDQVELQAPLPTECLNLIAQLKNKTS
jgi:23S rRNA pseudouridine955/2504/2580 synthase